MMGSGRLGAALRTVGWRRGARRVLALLEDERAMIVRGDLRGLAGLAARSRAALEEFASAAADAPETAETELSAIRTAADRNRRLLRALMEGASAAREELKRADLERSRLGYDRGGGTVGAGSYGRSTRA